MNAGIVHEHRDCPEAIADLAGGTWPARARAAAVAFTESAEDTATDQNLSKQALFDIREVFTDEGVGTMVGPTL